MEQIWRESRAIAQRILTEWWRRKSRLGFWIIFPVFVLLLNGLIVADRAELPLAVALDFACPATIVGVALFFSCVGGTVATLVTERERGTLKRLFLSPLLGVSYFLGIGIAQSTVAIAQSVVLIGMALSLGAKYQGSIGLGLGILFLSILTYVGIGFILGTQLAQKTEDVNTLVAAFGVPLLILGGAFFPVSIFPETLLNIAQFDPIFHMIQSLSFAWTGSDFSGFQHNFYILLIIAIFALITGSFTYRQMWRRDRRL